MTTSRPQQLCVICGRSVATTGDHIPPKSIFPKPRPNDLIRVPACGTCNMGASGLDEKFRVYLSLQVGVDSHEAHELWKNHVVRTARHNDKLRNEIVARTEPVYLTTQAGVIFDKAYRVLWDSQAHDKTIERLIRGLYFHHFREILGDRIAMKVQWFRKLTADMDQMSQEWNSNSIGGNIFLYRFARAKDEPLTSIWIFQFYRKHWAGGYTLPADFA